MKILKPLFVFFFFFLCTPEVCSVTSSRISNLSEPNTFFTGRDKEIKDLSLALEKKTIIVVEGLSGIGKTQLAKKYSQSVSNKYDLIWWFDSEKNMDTQVDELLSKLYRRANKPYYRPAKSQELIKKLKAELNLTALTYLLVFDNIDDINMIQHYATLKRNDMRSQHIIATSKKKNTIFSSLLIDKFERKESLAFLAKILEGEKEENLDALAETLGDFPLALAQAASFIKMNPSVSVKTYIQLFKESYAELWKSEGKLIEDTKSGAYFNDNYHKSMATAIKMNIEDIKKRSPLAYEMLCFSSLLHHHHIPFSVLEHWACSKRRASKIEFHEALSLLLNYFLLEREAEKTDTPNNDLFRQHELIQLITSNTFEKDQKKALLNAAADSLVQELSIPPVTLLEQFKEKEYFYNHMEKVCTLASELDYDDRSLTELKIALLYFVHFIQRDFTQSSELIKSLKKDVDSHSKDISPLAQIWFYCTIGNDQMFEDFSQVQQSYEKGLKCLEMIQDAEIKRSYFMHLTYSYIESLCNIGRLREAIALCDGLQDTLKASNNLSQKIAFLGASGSTRIKHGQYALALKELDLCLELISQQKDMENFRPFAMLLKAQCILCQGQTQQAHEIIEEIYPRLLKVFVSPESMVLVKCQIIKGASLASFGKREEAIDIVKQSLESYEKSSGFENDVLKGLGYRILGEIYEADGNLPKAYEQYAKAESIYAKILQEKSLADLGLLYMRLAILGAKMKDDTMVKKYLTLHINDFGLSHPRTLEIKEYLDGQGFSVL